MGDPGAQVTGGVQGIAGQAAQGHADGYDDAEDQQLAHACIQAGNLIHAADGKHQNEGGDGFLQDIAAGVGDGGAGGEHAQLGAGIFRGVKLILEQNVNQDTATDTAQNLSNDVAGNQSPIEHAAHSQSNGQRGVEAGAGSLTEDKGGNHNGKAPGNGDLNGTGTLHAGLIEVYVGDNAVAQEDQDHGAQKLSNIR